MLLNFEKHFLKSFNYSLDSDRLRYNKEPTTYLKALRPVISKPVISKWIS